MSGEFFVSYLHQNYLDFFPVLEDVIRATDYLSDADHLTTNWTVSTQHKEIKFFTRFDQNFPRELLLTQ